jgi:hypothetical protein
MTVHDFLRRCRRTAPILVALCSLAASAGQAGAQRRTQLRSERERIDTTFAFDKNGSVTLTATSGDIIVGGSADARIHVVATSESGNLSLDASPNRVILQNRSGESRFEITVPYGVQVIARSQSGDMRIRDTRGTIEAHASSTSTHSPAASPRVTSPATRTSRPPAATSRFSTSSATPTSAR